LPLRLRASLKSPRSNIDHPAPPAGKDSDPR
jgi:hypothetical protein